MKKIAAILIVALAAAGVVGAQPWNGPYSGQAQAQTVKVDGKLALINGTIGLQSAGKTYYVPRLARLSGFVDGVKEGANVRVEGYEWPLPYATNTSMLAVTKLTVGGKDYDLGQFAGPGRGFGPGMGYGMGPGAGPGMMGRRGGGAWGGGPRW